MLVLSRRLNEKLLLPCIRTAIQVLSIQGGQVRLGVDAPMDVAVFREEIYQGDAEAAPLDLVQSALRNRLASLAAGLNRAHGRAQGKLTPAARAEMGRLADECEELARIVKMLLEEDDASNGRKCVVCAH